jgi:hypothetical protein
MTYFTDEQIELLLKPIHPNRVSNLRGLSYVEGYDIRAELTRIFGFGRWSEDTMEQSLVCETEIKTNAGKPAWYVVYRTRLRLTVFAPDGHEVTHYEGAHVGESTHPVRGEAHGNALTNSQTYALRRCAINLGDQFGLSLYNKGSQEAIVRWTLVRPEKVTVDTGDVPVISPEEPESTGGGGGGEFSTANELKITPGKTRSRKPEKPLEDRIREAVTVEQLRACFKDAGSSGVLENTVTLGEEKITIRDWLFRRSDELGTPKSPSGSPGNTGTDSGGE